MSEKQTIKSSIVEIADANGVTKEATMIVHKIGEQNYNGLCFQQPYVDEFMNTIINKPIVTKYLPIQDDLGDHAPVFDSEGNIVGLDTIAIGTITDAWVADLPEEDQHDDVIQGLYIKSTLWNYKYPEIIACLQRLFDNDDAETSVEVEIYDWDGVPSPQFRVPSNYSYLGNCCLGSRVQEADNTAGVISIAQKEIASAVKKDLDKLNSSKGVDKVADKKDVEVFNKGKEIKYHGKFEMSSLSFSDVANQIYNLLNPVDPKNGGRDYDYDICDMYVDHVIVEDWDDCTLYSISYSIDNNQVMLAPKDHWVSGSYQFVPDGVDVDNLVVGNNDQITELNTCLTKTKEDMSKMADEKDKEIASLKADLEKAQKEMANLQTKFDEMNEVLVDEKLGNTEVNSKNEKKIKELEAKVEELAPFKEQVEKTEHDQKVKDLAAKYQPIMSKELFESEETQNLVNELKVTELNSLVVEEMKSTQEAKAKEIAEKDNKDDVATEIASEQPKGFDVDENTPDFWAAPVEK